PGAERIEERLTYPQRSEQWYRDWEIQVDSQGCFSGKMELKKIADQRKKEDTEILDVLRIRAGELKQRFGMDMVIESIPEGDEKGYPSRSDAWRKKWQVNKEDGREWHSKIIEEEFGRQELIDKRIAKDRVIAASLSKRYGLNIELPTIVPRDSYMERSRLWREGLGIEKSGEEWRSDILDTRASVYSCAEEDRAIRDWILKTYKEDIGLPGTAGQEPGAEYLELSRAWRRKWGISGNRQKGWISGVLEKKKLQEKEIHKEDKVEELLESAIYQILRNIPGNTIRQQIRLLPMTELTQEKLLVVIRKELRAYVDSMFKHIPMQDIEKKLVQQVAIIRIIDQRDLKTVVIERVVNNAMQTPEMPKVLSSFAVAGIIRTIAEEIEAKRGSGAAVQTGTKRPRIKAGAGWDNFVWEQLQKNGAFKALSDSKNMQLIARILHGRILGLIAGGNLNRSFTFPLKIGEADYIRLQAVAMRKAEGSNDFMLTNDMRDFIQKNITDLAQKTDEERDGGNKTIKIGDLTCIFNPGSLRSGRSLYIHGEGRFANGAAAGHLDGIQNMKSRRFGKMDSSDAFLYAHNGTFLTDENIQKFMEYHNTVIHVAPIVSRYHADMFAYYPYIGCITGFLKCMHELRENSILRIVLHLTYFRTTSSAGSKIISHGTMYAGMDYSRLYRDRDGGIIHELKDFGFLKQQHIFGTGNPVAQFLTEAYKTGPPVEFMSYWNYFPAIFTSANFTPFSSRIFLHGFPLIFFISSTEFEPSSMGAFSIRGWTNGIPMEAAYQDGGDFNHWIPNEILTAIRFDKKLPYVIVEDYESLSETITRIAGDLIKNRPDAVILIPGCDTPLGFYQRLAEKAVRKEVDISRVRFVTLDSPIGLRLDDLRNFKMFMYSYLYRYMYGDIPQGLDKEQFLRGFYEKHPNFIVPYVPIDSSEKEAGAIAGELGEAFERMGYADLAFLGLGRAREVNGKLVGGHLAFNEPGSLIDSKSRIVDLTDYSVETKFKCELRLWDNNDYILEQPPLRAITLGIMDLLSSRRIIIAASGKNKSREVRHLLEAEMTSDFPATYLHTVPEKTLVIVDEEAAVLLKRNRGRVDGGSMYAGFLSEDVYSGGQFRCNFISRIWLHGNGPQMTRDGGDERLIVRVFARLLGGYELLPESKKYGMLIPNFVVSTRDVSVAWTEDNMTIGLLKLMFDEYRQRRIPVHYLASSIAHEWATLLLGHHDFYEQADESSMGRRARRRFSLTLKAQELEADALAVKIMAATGYPPEEYAASFEIDDRLLDKAEKRGLLEAEDYDGVSEHPSDRKRIRAVRQLGLAAGSPRVLYPIGKEISILSKGTEDRRKLLIAVFKGEVIEWYEPYCELERVPYPRMFELRSGRRLLFSEKYAEYPDRETPGDSRDGGGLETGSINVFLTVSPARIQANVASNGGETDLIVHPGFSGFHENLMEESYLGRILELRRYILEDTKLKIILVEYGFFDQTIALLRIKEARAPVVIVLTQEKSSEPLMGIDNFMNMLYKIGARFVRIHGEELVCVTLPSNAGEEIFREVSRQYSEKYYGADSRCRDAEEELALNRVLNLQVADGREFLYAIDGCVMGMMLELFRRRSQFIFSWGMVVLTPSVILYEMCYPELTAVLQRDIPDTVMMPQGRVLALVMSRELPAVQGMEVIKRAAAQSGFPWDEREIGRVYGYLRSLDIAALVKAYERRKDDCDGGTEDENCVNVGGPEGDGRKRSRLTNLIEVTDNRTGENLPIVGGILHMGLADLSGHLLKKRLDSFGRLYLENKRWRGFSLFPHAVVEVLVQGGLPVEVVLLRDREGRTITGPAGGEFRVSLEKDRYKLIKPVPHIPSPAGIDRVLRITHGEIEPALRMLHIDEETSRTLKAKKEYLSVIEKHTAIRIPSPDEFDSALLVSEGRIGKALQVLHITRYIYRKHMRDISPYREIIALYRFPPVEDFKNAFKTAAGNCDAALAILGISSQTFQRLKDIPTYNKIIKKYVFPAPRDFRDALQRAGTVEKALRVLGITDHTYRRLKEYPDYAVILQEHKDSRVKGRVSNVQIREALIFSGFNARDAWQNMQSAGGAITWSAFKTRVQRLFKKDTDLAEVKKALFAQRSKENEVNPRVNKSRIMEEKQISRALNKIDRALTCDDLIKALEIFGGLKLVYPDHPGVVAAAKKVEDAANNGALRWSRVPDNRVRNYACLVRLLGVIFPKETEDHAVKSDIVPARGHRNNVDGGKDIFNAWIQWVQASSDISRVDIHQFWFLAYLSRGMDESRIAELLMIGEREIAVLRERAAGYGLLEFNPAHKKYCLTKTAVYVLSSLEFILKEETGVPPVKTRGKGAKSKKRYFNIWDVSSGRVIGQKLMITPAEFNAEEPLMITGFESDPSGKINLGKEPVVTIERFKGGITALRGNKQFMVAMLIRDSDGRVTVRDDGLPEFFVKEGEHRLVVGVESAIHALRTRGEIVSMRSLARELGVQRPVLAGYLVENPAVKNRVDEVILPAQAVYTAMQESGYGRRKAGAVLRGPGYGYHFDEELLVRRIEFLKAQDPEFSALCEKGRSESMKSWWGGKKLSAEPEYTKFAPWIQWVQSRTSGDFSADEFRVFVWTSAGKDDDDIMSLISCSSEQLRLYRERLEEDGLLRFGLKENRYVPTRAAIQLKQSMEFILKDYEEQDVSAIIGGHKKGVFYNIWNIDTGLLEKRVNGFSSEMLGDTVPRVITEYKPSSLGAIRFGNKTIMTFEDYRLCEMSISLYPDMVLVIIVKDGEGNPVVLRSGLPLFFLKERGQRTAVGIGSALERIRARGEQVTLPGLAKELQLQKPAFASFLKSNEEWKDKIFDMIIPFHVITDALKAGKNDMHAIGTFLRERGYSVDAYLLQTRMRDFAERGMLAGYPPMRRRRSSRQNTGKYGQSPERKKDTGILPGTSLVTMQDSPRNIISALPPDADSTGAPGNIGRHRPVICGPDTAHKKKREGMVTSGQKSVLKRDAVALLTEYCLLYFKAGVITDLMNGKREAEQLSSFVQTAAVESAEEQSIIENALDTLIHNHPESSIARFAPEEGNKGDACNLFARIAGIVYPGMNEKDVIAVLYKRIITVFYEDRESIKGVTMEDLAAGILGYSPSAQVISLFRQICGRFRNGGSGGTTIDPVGILVRAGEDSYSLRRVPSDEIFRAINKSAAGHIRDGGITAGEKNGDGSIFHPVVELPKIEPSPFFAGGVSSEDGGFAVTVDSTAADNRPKKYLSEKDLIEWMVMQSSMVISGDTKVLLRSVFTIDGILEQLVPKNRTPADRNAVSEIVEYLES
ncbi:MAG: hypothetical protein PHC33_02350, partial [Candidatus Omnitrophica bacterium]|nr:hypothetical protein [Candidatus Omnitrophota bacterium]